MVWHTMQEIWERGFKEVMRTAVGEALAKAEKLYVSVDIDVLDPGPRAGHRDAGARWHHQLPTCCGWCANSVTSTTWSGSTWSRWRPAYDHAELTVNAAHRVVFEALSGHGRPPPRRRRREGRTAVTAGPVAVSAYSGNGLPARHVGGRDALRTVLAERDRPRVKLVPIDEMLPAAWG